MSFPVSSICAFRFSRRTWRILPAVCLLTALTQGCWHLQQQQKLVTTPEGKVVAIDQKDEKDLPKRQPQPSSLVGFANFRAQSARDPECAQPEQERLRDEARRAYQHALELDPKCIDAYTGLASLYQDMGDAGHANATYERALKLFPKNAELWYQCSICQARQKDWDGAISSMRTAAQLDPENRRLQSSLGFTLARAGRYDEAFDCLQKEMGEARAHYNVARMLHHVHQDDACKLHLELALKASPDLVPARQLMAELEKANGTNMEVVPVRFVETKSEIK
jgi:tetratricopeptide (TPR) repeat protein